MVKLVKRFLLDIKGENEYKDFKKYCLENNMSVGDAIWQLMEVVATNYRSQKHGLDKFVESTSTTKPQIDDDFEAKIKPYLKTCNQKTLELLNRNYFKGNYFIKALLELEPNTRKTFETTDYLELWRKHRL